MNLRQFREDEWAKNKKSDKTVQGYYQSFNRKSNQNKNGKSERVNKMIELLDSGVNDCYELKSKIGISIYTLTKYAHENNYSIFKGKVVRK